MTFRFDMQGKTPQQRIIVEKRDSEDKRRQQEAAKRKAEKKTLDDVNTNTLILTIDKDTCPNENNIIMKQHCSVCEYYKDFTMYNGQPCVKCSYKLSILNEQ